MRRGGAEETTASFKTTQTSPITKTSKGEESTERKGKGRKKKPMAEHRQYKDLKISVEKNSIPNRLINGNQLEIVSGFCRVSIFFVNGERTKSKINKRRRVAGRLSKAKVCFAAESESTFPK